MENEIKLVQNPIIKHEIAKIGKSVTARLDELNLKNQVATSDTIQTLKKLRAELNKEHSEYKGQLKIVKDEILKSFNEVKPLYETEISEKYENAESILKTKIGDFETTIKEEKEANVKAYFIELCQSYNIDFLIYNDLGIDINLSTSEKKYKEQCNTFIEKIVDDIELINLQDFKVEIMVEFKKDLNASKAIKDVQLRKQQEKEEQAREDEKTLNNRISKLKAIGMSFDEMTKTYIYNDEIFIKESEIMSFESGEFSLKIVKLDEQIIADIKSKEVKPELKKETEKPVHKTIEVKQEPIKEVLKAPVKEIKEEQFTASFEVTATMKQLKALKVYMQENNLTFKTI